MSAYWICVYKAVHDQDKVTAYADLAGPAIRAGGGRFLARGVPEATFEQAEPTRTGVCAGVYPQDVDRVSGGRTGHGIAPRLLTVRRPHHDFAATRAR